MGVEAQKGFSCILFLKASLSLGQETTDCQIMESYNDCATRKYIDALLRNCKCLQYNIMLMENKVVTLIVVSYCSLNAIIPAEKCKCLYFRTT